MIVSFTCSNCGRVYEHEDDELDDDEIDLAENLASDDPQWAWVCENCFEHSTVH